MILLPPDVEFHEDIRLLIYRPRGLLDETTINRIVSIIGELEANGRADRADCLEIRHWLKMRLEHNKARTQQN